MRGRVSWLLAAGFAAAACGSPVARFYLLKDRAAPAAPATSGPGFAGTVVVDRVSLPDLVDRPQLVVADDDRVLILEQERWGEPLKSGIAVLMAAQLSRLLDTRMVSSNEEALGRADYAVTLDVRRFEANPEVEVTVEALWQVQDRRSGAQRRGHSLIREKVGGASYDDVVAADARAIEAVSRQVADGLRALAQAAPAAAPASPGQ